MTAVQFPRPADWQQFERLCLAVIMAHTGASFQRHGRSGQRQHGVDILGYRDNMLVAVQCKSRREDIALAYTKEAIDEAVAEAATFPHHIDQLYLMTTAPADAELESYAAGLTCEFTVFVWGWDTISDVLNANPEVARKQYGFGRQKILAAITLALALLVVGGFLLLSNYESASKRQLIDAQSSTDIRESIDELSAIQAKFEQCGRLYSKFAYVYYRPLAHACSSPIDDELRAINNHQERLSATLPRHVYESLAFVSAALEAQEQDERKAEMLTQMFESSVAESWLSICGQKKGGKSDHDPWDTPKNRDIGREALESQLKTYFLLRDYTNPEIAQMKARLAVAMQGELGSVPAPDIVATSNALEQTLKAASLYEYRPSEQPLALARVKNLSGENLTVSGPPMTDIEAILWHQLIFELIARTFDEHPSVVERGVACGIFKPSALSGTSPPLPNGFSPISSDL